MIVVRDARPEDVRAITDIQNALIDTTSYEWREDLHTVDSRAEWLADKQGGGWPVVVAVEDVTDEVLGFAFYGDFRDSSRWPGYRTTVEHTIHVRGDQWGKGVGRLLLAELEHRARAAGKHVMIGGIDATNDGSIVFHRRLGYEEVARLPQVGVKFGEWLDLVLMQKRLDHRTPDGR